MSLLEKTLGVLPSVLAFLLVFCGCALFGLKDPDGSDDNHSSFIDLDGDGTTDFALERPRPVGNETTVVQIAKVVPKGDNEIVRAENGNVATFTRGNLIDETLPDTLEWVSQAPYLYSVTYYSFRDSSSVTWRGPWPSERDRYLGLKLVRGGKPYYGWARVDVDTSSEAVHVRDLGYNPHPGRSIRAGHKP